MLAGDDRIVRQMGLSDRTRFVLNRGFVTRENYRMRSILLAPSLLRVRAPGNLLALSYAFAHFANARGRKVVYCHSPLRQIWSGRDEYAAALGPVSRALLNLGFPLLRRLDRHAAHTAQTYIATSTVVADRVSSYYKAPRPTVIPPPIDTSLFAPPLSTPTRDYYVWAGRIVEPYKRVRLLLDAFRELPDQRLVIAGDGRDTEDIRRHAPPNASFVGALGGSELSELYQGARALLFPSTDDFGMAPLEAMACGTPVVAFRGGGALDTVIDGQTGVLFDEPNPAALIAAIRRLDTLKLDRDALVEHAAGYGADRFAQRLGAVLSAAPSRD